MREIGVLRLRPMARSRKVRAQIAGIFQRQRAQLAAGATAGVAMGALTGIAHRTADEKGWSMTIPKTKVGWLTVLGLGAGAAALAKRKKWSIPVAMAGTSLAASDIAVQVSRG